MEFYNFSVYPNTVIELIFSLEDEYLGYYLQFHREGYPWNSYFKFTPDSSKILEYYPYHILNLQTSMDIFFGKKSFSEEEYGKLFLYEYKYYSFDGKNTPTQIYDGMDGPFIYRYDLNNNLEATYVNVNRSEYPEMIKQIKDLPLLWKKRIKKYNPDYVILAMDKNKKLRKFIMGYYYNNSTYNKIIEEYDIKFLKIENSC